MDRIAITGGVLLLLAALAVAGGPGGISDSDFSDVQTAVSGTAFEISIDGFVAAGPFDVDGTEFSGLVSGINTRPDTVIVLKSALVATNGITFEPATDLEAPQGTTFTSGRQAIRYISADFSGFEGCLPIEGTTGPLSDDIYVLRADIGARVPAISQANQFRCQYETVESAGAPEALVFYLRAGTLRNELTLRTITWADPPVFGAPVQLDGGDYQITDFGLSTLRTTFQFKGPPAPASVVAWDSFGSDGDDNSLRSIQARFLDASGTPLAAQAQVNTFTSGDQYAPRAAGNGQRFVIVWTSVGSPADDASLTSIQARLYDSVGAPVGNQFQVNQATMGDQYEPGVAMLEDGRFIVTWTDLPLTTSNVFARGFAADGAPLTDQFQLNSTAGADASAVASNGHDILIVWRRDNVIEARTAYTLVFANGFEG